MSSINDTAPILQLEVCKEQVEWAKTEKRTFLRQRIEARLANLYLGSKDFSAALALISRLLSEVSTSSCPYHCFAHPSHLILLLRRYLYVYIQQQLQQQTLPIALRTLSDHMIGPLQE